jgi:arylsulfatase A-like enzyme
MRYYLALILIGFLFIQSKPKHVSKNPNVVLIFMDDMGYGDLSCYGATTYRTPNLDKLASEGIRFTNFLATQPICTASRTALLTGCYPNRVNLTAALMPYHKTGIHENEKTLAELLKEQNYATGIFGKWHLGHYKQFLPLQHGFDEYVGLPYSNDMWSVFYDGGKAPAGHSKNEMPPLPLYENNEKIKEISSLKEQETLTTLYTEKAISFITKNKNKPFFVYLPHSMPHVPIAVSDKFKGKSKQGLYADMMLEVDWSVGEIMKALKKHNLEENTIVIFTSDNGPWLTFGNHAGSSGGLREGKQTSFEGGHRVPCIMKWKGKTPEGAVCNQLATNMDIYPTIANLCSGKLPTHTIDGKDLTPILKGNMDFQAREVFYYYYLKNSLQAVRKGNWKLILPHESPTFEGIAMKDNGFPTDNPKKINVPLALYDLRRDPAERNDLQNLYPDIVKDLQKIANEAREDLGDDLMKVPSKNSRPCGVVNQ